MFVGYVGVSRKPFGVGMSGYVPFVPFRVRFFVAVLVVEFLGAARHVLDTVPYFLARFPHDARDVVRRKRLVVDVDVDPFRHVPRTVLLRNYRQIVRIYVGGG